MRVSIHGLGYVGSVSLGCFAQNGHDVIGVDINPAKVDLINRGESPIVEKDLGRIIRDQRRKGRVRATLSGEEAVIGSEVSFICVGTPSTKEGHLDLEGIFGVSRRIGEAIAKKRTPHVVVIRSTVLPGTNEKVTDLIARLSGKTPGRDFSVVSNPEFLREGTAVHDFLNPPFTLIGASDSLGRDRVTKVYRRIKAPIVHSETKVAEFIKYVNNSFHALKICFANEVGNVCKALGIDSHELMEIFCRDTKLNISPSYLKPGFAYGGSCLPKDLRALCAIAHDHYLKCPVLENIEASNETQKNRVLEMILEFGKRRIGFLGLSFKEGTDDVRSSPIVDVLEKLLGKGFDVKIYDESVNISRLVGKNRDFLLQRIPFIVRFLADDPAEVMAHAEVVVVVNKEPAFKRLLEKAGPSKIILDLVNYEFRGRKSRAGYRGVSW